MDRSPGGRKRYRAEIEAPGLARINLSGCHAVVAEVDVVEGPEGALAGLRFHALRLELRGSVGWSDPEPPNEELR